MSHCQYLPRKHVCVVIYNSIERNNNKNKGSLQVHLEENCFCNIVLPFWSFNLCGCSVVPPGAAPTRPPGEEGDATTGEPQLHWRQTHLRPQRPSNTVRVAVHVLNKGLWNEDLHSFPVCLKVTSLVFGFGARPYTRMLHEVNLLKKCICQGGTLLNVCLTATSSICSIMSQEWNKKLCIIKRYIYMCRVMRKPALMT